MKKYAPWKITMNKSAMTRQPPSGPGFSKEEADKADSMSATLFTATDSSSEDYIKYVLHEKDGTVITQKTIYV
jgi:hypothetical protein